jgi:hypothetical protein
VWKVYWAERRIIDAMLYRFSYSGELPRRAQARDFAGLLGIRLAVLLPGSGIPASQAPAYDTDPSICDRPGGQVERELNGPPVVLGVRAGRHCDGDAASLGPRAAEPEDVMPPLPRHVSPESG